ncbi:hypothetical protein [Rheinheimera maricola]|uniref:MarR family transcriptional regulator n=1 Tax=Rheinheimera maricola TaxID=2793282 RepID=A0ABS7XDA4_9GAMM|nr:hypothetical protein [Rheinheimera maricola]MBZ9612688.1 hypothetical protein [Rheinheimera maricola]
MTDNSITYHEIDFLLPAQKFSIQFSYISQRGLPFIREYVLRLVHVAPMSKHQIAQFFGLSKREADEVISDLVDRSEITLAMDGRLTLTEKSKSYFPGMGQAPLLSITKESSANLWFDLATFCCFSNQNISDKWRAGVSLKVDESKAAISEKLAEKNFQLQFNQILDRNYLSLINDNTATESPSVYTVKTVKKLRTSLLRLKTSFQMDIDGNPLERNDFSELIDSQFVHELIATELYKSASSSNLVSLLKAMNVVGDTETLKLFDSQSNAFNPNYINDLRLLEEHSNSGRHTFLGPIYSSENWITLQKFLAPIIKKRRDSKEDSGYKPFLWLAPSDKFWGKSERLVSSLSDVISNSTTKTKTLYKPNIYLPINGADDIRTCREWEREFPEYKDYLKGIKEGFLDGNVEILLIEDELAVVSYHFSQPELLPVTLPVGFISTNHSFIAHIGQLVTQYLNDASAFDKPNDCGFISELVKRR